MNGFRKLDARIPFSSSGMKNVTTTLTSCVHARLFGFAVALGAAALGACAGGEASPGASADPVPGTTAPAPGTSAAESSTAASADASTPIVSTPMEAAVAEASRMRLVDDGGRACAIEIGDVRVVALLDGVSDTGPTFPFVGANASRERVEAAAAIADQTRALFNVSAFVVETPEQTVLVDAGYGPYAPDAKTGHVGEALQLAGYVPSDIQVAVLTHAHIDHLGGFVSEDKSPAFPNARIHMTAAERDFWLGTPDTSQMTITETFQRTLKTDAREALGVISEQTSVFDADQLPLTGVSAILVPGHTPGHVNYLFGSADAPSESVRHIGDLLHMQQLQLPNPSWQDGADTYPLVGIRQRETVLGELADSGQVIMSGHFPWPGIGTIRRSDLAPEGFAFQPAPGCESASTL